MVGKAEAVTSNEVNQQAWKEGVKVGGCAGLALTALGIGSVLFMHQLTGTWDYTAVPLILTTVTALAIAWETKGREAAKLRQQSK